MGDQRAFDITVGAAAQLVFTTQPGSGTGGPALGTQPTVTIEDAGGNTVSTDTNTITLAIGTNPSAGTLSGCSATTVAGVAAFSGCKIDTAGTGYTLTATDATDSLSKTSSAFNVTVGAAAQLVFTTQPGNGTGGSALSHPAHGHRRGRRRQHGHDRHQHDHLGHRHQPERGHPLGVLQPARWPGWPPSRAARSTRPGPATP